MHRPILALVLATFSAHAFADDTGVHPAMECAPDDQACIDQANRQYEAEQRARKGAAVPVAPAPARPVEAEEPTVEPMEPTGALPPEAPTAIPVEEQGSSQVGTRTFYRDEGLYVAVWTVEDQVMVVEAHPEKAVEAAAQGVDEPNVPEEDAAMLQRSAKTWKDLAQSDLPDAAERQIRLTPVPAG